MNGQPDWNPISDLQLLLHFHFMQNALEVGTLVAILAGTTGYFIVLRGQSFAAHMLSQVGFPGAAAGVLLQVSPVVGLIAFCSVAALGISATGRNLDAGRRTESAAVGSILAFSLGLGLLFFRLYRGGGSVQAVYGFLFGTILGISDRDVMLTLFTTATALAALSLIARPLIFASVDPDVAEARGVPVRAVSIAFLLIVALSVAVTVQVVGTLLIFALLVAPGASALELTPRPQLALALTVGLSLLFTWTGLAVAYFTGYPVGFLITTLAFVTYGMIRVARATRAQWSLA